MGYQAAINKAWEDLEKLNPPENIQVRFLADTYSADAGSRKLFSASCNVAVNDFFSILILHYLAAKFRGLPGLTGEWLDFKELSGVEGYEPAFRKRSIDPLIRKYGKNSDAILDCLKRFPGKKAKAGDVGLVIEVFEGVPVLITLWRADEEFAPEANLLFDRSVSKIFCTEDIVVLAQIVAIQL